MRFVVTEAHRGSVHAPLLLKKGDLVSMGETYKGPENWPEWVWCVSAGNIGAWVPLQILEKREDGTAVALEDYSSNELDADEGDAVTGTRETNGWLWCVRARDGVSGWVPRDKLRSDQEP
jgi:hypothetical protein